MRHWAARARLSPPFGGVHAQGLHTESLGPQLRERLAKGSAPKPIVVASAALELVQRGRRLVAQLRRMVIVRLGQARDGGRYVPPGRGRAA